MANLIGAYALSEHAPEGGSNRSRSVALLTPTNGLVNNGNGEFEVRAEDLELYADSLRKAPLRPQFDYDHSFLDRGDSKAAGWIDQTSVRVDGNKVVGDVEWTPKAAASIRDREYLYVSPEFIPIKRDDAGEITQHPKLIAAGLTNRPFLKTLGEIALSDKTLHDLALEQNPLSLVDDTAATRLAKHFGVSAEDIHALSGGRTPDPKPSQEDDMSSLKDTAKALGLSEDASEVDVITAVQALKSTAEKAPDAATIQKLTDAAEQGVKALAEVHEIKRTTLLDTATLEGRMLPRERESLEALYNLAPDNVKALLDAREKGSFSEKGSGEGGAQGAAEKQTATSDGTEYEFDVSPDAIERATIEALKEKGLDPNTSTPEQRLAAGRKAYQNLRAA